MKTLRRTLAIVIAGSLGVQLWLRWPGPSDEQPFSRVEEGLYLGSSVSQPPPGTLAVVNLCGLKDPYPAEASLWEPILEGGSEPDLAWLCRVVEFIAAQRRAGRTTYVHCMAGVNRSAAGVAAYLMQEHGWSRDKALSFLKEKRPIVHPDPTLTQLLADWQHALKEKSPPGR
jgi:hypothetical protein